MDPSNKYYDHYVNMKTKLDGLLVYPMPHSHIIHHHVRWKVSVLSSPYMGVMPTYLERLIW